jgi:hypothetical protein
MCPMPNFLRITIQLISIMIFIQWTQGGTGVTQKPSKKEKYHAIMRTVLIAEAFTNCTCPKDTPMDSPRILRVGDTRENRSFKRLSES